MRYAAAAVLSLLAATAHAQVLTRTDCTEWANELDARLQEHKATPAWNLPKKMDLQRVIDTRREAFERYCARVYGCEAGFPKSATTYSETMESLNRSCETKAEKKAREKRELYAREDAKFIADAPNICAQAAKDLDKYPVMNPEEFMELCIYPLRCDEYFRLPKTETYSGQWEKVSTLCKEEFQNLELNIRIRTEIKKMADQCPKISLSDLNELPLHQQAFLVQVACENKK